MTDDELKDACVVNKDTQERICENLLDRQETNFVQNPDAAGKLGATTNQQLCASLRILCGGG